MATYAVGDIHGQRAALDALLEQITPVLTAKDTLVFLGDFLDRGPDTKGCLDRLVELKQEAPCGVEAVLGNHEEWFLDTYRDPTRHSWLLGMNGLDTVASYSVDVAESLREALQANGMKLLTEKVALPYDLLFDAMPTAHLTLLESLPPFVRTDDVVCVHGGAKSGIAAEDQTAHDLVWGPPSFPAAYFGPDLLVYGHRNDGAVVDDRPQPTVNQSGLASGIDTIAQGVLTCLRFPDLKVFGGAVP